LSITPSFIAQLEEKNPKWFKQVNALKQDIDTPLAAILTLNTIAHTVGAAGVGAQVAAMYGQAYLGFASGIMTLAILVLSEILPKTIGAKYWRKLVPSMCITLRVMIVLLRPFLYISSFIMGMFGSAEDASDIKDEIKALAKMGRDEKVLDDNKYRVISNVINLQEVRVKDVMTPRTVVHTVRPGTTIREFDKFLESSPFSRFPIIDETEQKYLGYIHKSSSYKADDNRRSKITRARWPAFRQTPAWKTFCHRCLTTIITWRWLSTSLKTGSALLPLRTLSKPSSARKSSTKPTRWPTCACMPSSNGRRKKSRKASVWRPFPANKTFPRFGGDFFS